MGHIAVQYMGQTKPYVEEWLKNSPLLLHATPPTSDPSTWPGKKKKKKKNSSNRVDGELPPTHTHTRQHQQVIATVHRLTKPYETVWLENYDPSCIKKLTYTNYHNKIVACCCCIASHCNYKQYHKKILTFWRCIASHCDYIYIDLHTHLMRAAWWRRIRGGHLQPLILPDVVEEQVIVQEHLEHDHNLIQLCHGKLQLMRIIIIIIITQTEQTPRSLTFKN